MGGGSGGPSILLDIEKAEALSRSSSASVTGSSMACCTAAAVLVSLDVELPNTDVSTVTTTACTSAESEGTDPVCIPRAAASSVLFTTGGSSRLSSDLVEFTRKVCSVIANDVR